MSRRGTVAAEPLWVICAHCTFRHFPNSFTLKPLAAVSAGPTISAMKRIRVEVLMACVAGLALASTHALQAEATAPKSGVRIVINDPPAADAKKAAAPATAKPASNAPATKVATPRTPAAVPAHTEPKKPSMAPAIEGIEIQRGDRGYLGLTIEKGGFKMTFYDREKMPVTPDVALVALRWPVNYQKSDERTTLLPSPDGKAMVSEKIVRPPFSFKVYMTLLKDNTPGADPGAESYVIDFRR